MPDLRRATSLGPGEVLLLRFWAESIWRSFQVMPYLVGSVARSEAWRDVDVRCVLPDDDPLLATPLRLAIVNMTFSLWGKQATGLPIDFQFQSTTENAKHHGQERQPLAVIDCVYPAAAEGEE